MTYDLMIMHSCQDLLFEFCMRWIYLGHHQAFRMPSHIGHVFFSHFYRTYLQANIKRRSFRWNSYFLDLFRPIMTQHGIHSVEDIISISIANLGSIPINEWSDTSMQSLHRFTWNEIQMQ
jgi:hypothetical protein